MTAIFDQNTCVVGLQWGDEGKGKIVDFLSESAEVVTRYCGGANAGHTVRIGEKKFATHLLPVGVFRSGVMNLIGNGVVLDPAVLVREIDQLNDAGVSVDATNLRISYKAHVVMPWHLAEDAARENAAEATAIGTTRRGIGPTYADKAHRTTAIRVADLLDEPTLTRKITDIARQKSALLGERFDADSILSDHLRLGGRLRPMVDDIGRVLLDARRTARRVLFEGAHAVLLDVDHGTYPFVTSSSCSSLGLFTGAGVPPQYVQNFVGVVKAYSTRVGAGPFPTEQDNSVGQRIRERGNEYGTTTRRPRRCGWFDAFAVRYACELSGITALAVTLLDVLGGFDELKICTGYTRRGQPVDYFRADGGFLAECEPVYQTLPGWSEEISDRTRYQDLPDDARRYVERIESLLEVPVRIVSVGPERSATIVR